MDKRVRTAILALFAGALMAVGMLCFLEILTSSFYLDLGAGGAVHDAAHSPLWYGVVGFLAISGSLTVVYVIFNQHKDGPAQK